jgi:hypothetical protein
MNSTRTGYSWRAVGGSILASALVLLLCLTSIAAADPSLHSLLHKDHDAPSHYCLVTALEHGHSDVTSVWVAVAPVVSAFPVATVRSESFFVSHDLTLHPERGPPVLS